MKTKPRGIHANFTVDCPTCQGDITVSNGRPEQHVCREPLQPVGEWQDALADYYDSGAIGDAPKRQHLEDIKF